MNEDATENDREKDICLDFQAVWSGTHRASVKRFHIAIRY
jgi:hypothetical protein